MAKPEFGDGASQRDRTEQQQSRADGVFSAQNTTRSRLASLAQAAIPSSRTAVTEGPRAPGPYARRVLPRSGGMRDAARWFSAEFHRSEPAARDIGRRSPARRAPRSRGVGVPFKRSEQRRIHGQAAISSRRRAESAAWRVGTEGLRSRAAVGEHALNRPAGLSGVRNQDVAQKARRDLGGGLARDEDPREGVAAGGIAGRDLPDLADAFALAHVEIVETDELAGDRGLDVPFAARARLSEMWPDGLPTISASQAGPGRAPV